MYSRATVENALVGHVVQIHVFIELPSHCEYSAHASGCFGPGPQVSFRVGLGDALHGSALWTWGVSRSVGVGWEGNGLSSTWDRAGGGMVGVLDAWLLARCI